ncbi:hypothetical protein E2C01_036246 [Portunus trituberculatus]|uniref:Uncharacterized protein n=1 Tax=Portunus trituberculatus TaxID=210409 RepID=A0A5B7F879_PORTR|nr:hypothetical protein [Portunus trituberculatus]
MRDDRPGRKGAEGHGGARRDTEGHGGEGGALTGQKDARELRKVSGGYLRRDRERPSETEREHKPRPARPHYTAPDHQTTALLPHCPAQPSPALASPRLAPSMSYTSPHLTSLA